MDNIFTLLSFNDSVFSTMTTASAPSGTGAPVIIFAVVPFTILFLEKYPAGISSIIINSAGTFERSSDITA